MATENYLSDDELRLDIQAYIHCGGNRSEAARQRRMPRKTYTNHLRAAELRFSIKLGKIADGRLEPVEYEAKPLPEPGKISRYIVTSIQNNTILHPGWENLLCYAEWLDSLPDSSCEVIVGTYTYMLDAYGAKLQERFSNTESNLWYAPETHEYICDHRVELAPGLIFCGEINILPTTQNPLAGMETYNGRKSNIVPAAKLALNSVASMPGEGTKMNYTTGTVTQRNYTRRRCGIVSEQFHSYGALLIEVDHEGRWFVRQLHLGNEGLVYDSGPNGYGPVLIRRGGARAFVRAEAITWGDLHAADIDPWVQECAFGYGGMLDTLRPSYSFLHDVFSMRACNPHEANDFHARYAKHSKGQDSVEQEVELTASTINGIVRDFSTTYIVSSNHDRHLSIWLNNADPRKDPVNAKYHSILQTALLDIIDSGRSDVSVLEYALRRAGLTNSVKFLHEGTSFVICKDRGRSVECAMHGDRGVSGTKGSTSALAKLGRAINKGHDHTASIMDHVYSAGACSLNFPYQRGPTKSSISHIVTWPDGSRQIVTMWGGKWRA